MKTQSLLVRDVKSGAEAVLADRYGQREAKAMIRVIFEDVLGWKPVDLILRADYELNDYTAERIWSITERVASGEPIQQVVGWADFCGLRFKVTKDTLIPRPETTELVDMITSDYSGRKDLRVLDCGTGSGCIAIALARALPFSAVTGIDISDGALKVARENASLLKTQVDFEHRDILSLSGNDKATYDIIVSNPPYIAEHERSSMEKNVLDYEPATALFVPDDAPLKFYHAIAVYGMSALCPDGRIYFEINPLYASELVTLIKSSGYSDVATHLDMEGKIRFLTATR